MALSQQGEYWYGSDNADLQAEIVRYSRENGHEAVKFATAACACGSHTFHLESDENEGAACRICTACGDVVAMGDSAEFLEAADFEDHACLCDGEAFHIVSGVALYPESNHVRWYYIGCRCPACNLVGVFAEWKCEAGDADIFLART